jgi:hypothetical protein
MCVAMVQQLALGGWAVVAVGESACLSQVDDFVQQDNGCADMTYGQTPTLWSVFFRAGM